MRIQLTLFCLLMSVNIFAVDDKAMQDLFKKYDLVMDQKKIELIDEVFSEKFIKESGGKSELISKIKDLTPPPSSVQKSSMTWKKGKGETIHARVKEVSLEKHKKESETTEFIVVIENSKPKIDGTISDAE